MSLSTFAVVRDPFDDSPFLPSPSRGIRLINGQPEIPARFVSQDPSGFGTFASKRIVENLRRRFRQVHLDESPDLVFANPCGPYPVPGLVPSRCEMLILYSAEWNAGPEWDWLVLAKQWSDRRVAIGPMLPPLYGDHQEALRADGGAWRLSCDMDMPLLPMWYAVDPEVFRPLGLERRHAWAPGVIDAARETYQRRYEFNLAIDRAGLTSPVHATPARGQVDGMEQKWEAFNRSLNTCRLVCCDGSSMRAPIAKFVEVAASGSPMLAAVPGGFDALGFVEGVHYIADDDGFDPIPFDSGTARVLLGADRAPIIEATAARLRRLIDDPRLPALGEAAATLVRERHTREIRGRQIDTLIDALLDGPGVPDVTWRDGRCWIGGAKVA